MIIIIFGLFYAVFLFFIYLLLITGWLIKKKDPLNDKKAFPVVSILIAARNEEKNIDKCLKSLQRLSYPSHLIEFLIGNDQSEDKTREITMQYAIKDPRIKIIDITKRCGEAKGKANVLAQLAKIAKGEFFFITDADIEVNPHWITGMLSYFKKESGIITGFTATKKGNLISRMQNLEWTNALGIMKVFADFKMPLTTMGNNMMISRNAYFATGGYENLRFSVTEDYELFKQVRSKGYLPAHVINTDVVNISAPAKDISNYFSQRQRWMKGVLQSPWYVKALVGTVYLYLPVLIIFILMYPVITFILFLCKNVLQIFFISLIKTKLQQKITCLDIFIFDIYFAFFSFASLIFTLVNKEVKWKGRKYKQ